MPPAGRPYTRQQARTDRAFLIVALVCFALTLAITCGALRVVGLI